MNVQDPNGKVFDAKMEPKRYPKQWECRQEGTKNEAKTSWGTVQDSIAEQDRSSIEKGCQNGVCGAVF
jgi:hypothetical protein